MYEINVALKPRCCNSAAVSGGYFMVPSTARCGQSGLAIAARPNAIASAPCSSCASPSASVQILPATTMRVAGPTADRNNVVACASGRLVVLSALCHNERCSKSMPSSTSHCATCSVSSRSRPLAWPKSSGDRRTPSTNVGAAALTARVTSRIKRARLARLPPHWSVR